MPLAPFIVNPAIPLNAVTSVPLQSVIKSTLSFMIGNVIWTILEYGMHRFLFHVDEWLPDRPFFLMLHFLLHGIHHYLPMDR
jgi:4-hydroxysphinganine ceramide fatty acyl 2-hydroxylase